MTHVATLISNPARPGITPVVVDAARIILPGVGNPAVLADGIAAGKMKVAPSELVADEAPPAEEPARKPETRVAAIGDSDIASNAYLGVQGNRDLFMNTVSWLAQQESLISIRPRDAADRRLTVTANYMEGIFYLSIFVIPLAILGTGVYSWWRRR